jgi:uncharacterized membrane protein YqjE
MSEPAGEHDLGERSTTALVSQLSEQVSRLVRDELRLAKLELTDKGKRAGLGAGLFGGAGLVALYGLAVLVAAVVLLLTLALPAWAAALIVAAVYGAIAAFLYMRGKDRVQEATPLKPEQTIDSVKEDVEWAKHPTSSARR